MKCKVCHSEIEKTSKFCSNCGKKQRHRKWPFIASLVVIFSLCFGVFVYYADLLPQTEEVVKTEQTTDDKQEPDKKDDNQSEEVEPATSKKEKVIIDEKDKETSRVELINDAQSTVYTLYSDRGQGSAFLYDDKGSIITNAHVVEGSFFTTVITNDEKEYIGEVIGYSNETDIAVIHVPELVGQQPFPLEKSEPSKVGQEVVALGSPLGYANTATVGHITGIDRNFHIPPHTFENVYQISAPIEPGNSGGPLLSINNEKIVAINSAKHLDTSNIAFSIPLNNVVSLIDGWIENPLSENEIAALFYDDMGNYYYELLWSLYEDYYFDGGYFLDDEYYEDDWYDDIYEDDYWNEYDYYEDDYYWDEYDYYEDDYYWNDEYNDWNDPWYEDDYIYENDTNSEEDIDDSPKSWEDEQETDHDEQDYKYDWEQYDDPHLELHRKHLEEDLEM